MKAVIISVGAELVSGEITDTNAAFLSRELGSLGIETLRHICVGDDEEALAAAMREGAALGKVVIVTGGIGPTPDDITRQATALAAQAPLMRNQDVLEHIRGMFASWGRGREMSENNAVQADFPEGAEVIENPHGTAAGFAVMISGTETIVLPGVPREMKLMWEHSVRERLTGRSPHVLVARTLNCFGLGESDISNKLGDLMAPGANPSVGDTAEEGVIRIRIRGSAETRKQAEAMVAATTARVRERLGEIVFGIDETTLQEAVVGKLLAGGLTVAVAESCTGGMVCRRITDVPGASGCFLEGVVAYHNDAKVRLLGVGQNLLERHGAVSGEVAAAMAEGVRERANSDWGLSTTGIAGPSGGTPEKPVGLVYVALCGPSGTQAHELRLRGSRFDVRDRTTKRLLNMLRLELAD